MLISADLNKIESGGASSDAPEGGGLHVSGLKTRAGAEKLEETRS